MTRIRTKLVIITIPILFLVLVTGYMGSARIAKNILNREINERISTETEIEKAYLEKGIDNARHISMDLSSVVSNTYDHEDLNQYISIMNSVLQNNQFILGVGIWFEPYQYDKEKQYVGPYVYQSGKEIKTTFEYSNEKYNYFKQNYYVNAKKEMKMTFTDMYFDKTSGLYMMTCSQPIIDKKGKFIGCISADIEMSSMQKYIADFDLAHNAKAFVINRDGKYIAAGDGNLVKNKISIADSTNASFRSIAAQIIEKPEGTLQYTQHKQKNKVYFSTLNELGWKMVVEVPESVVNAPIKDLLIIFVGIFGGSLLLLIFLIYIISFRSINRPVQAVLKELEIIGIGWEQADVEQGLKKRKDEFGTIGRSIEKTKERLRLYQEEINNSLEMNIAANEELQQQNEELLESELRINSSLEYSAALIEAIPDTVFVLSKDGEFLDCKGDLKSLFFDKEVFIGKKIEEVMPKEIADKGMQLIQKARLTGDIQKMEYEWTANSSTEFHELRIVKWFDGKVLALARNITDTHNYIKEIEFIGYHDQLTGLFNRRYFDLKVEEFFIAENYPIAIIISDLNGLKIINDSFGHEQGDEMLKKYAEILCNTGNIETTTSRIGGDEFLSILCNTNEANAKKYIKELSQKCNDERVNGIDISVSFGYSMVLNNTLAAQAAIKKAEDRMYQNKLYESSSRRSKIIDTILSTLHEKNPREEMHSRRVAELCEMMAKKMGMNDEEAKTIRTAGILHDIGKIGIKEELLNKPGLLNPEEYVEICKHPEIGYRILNTAPNMSEIAEIVLAHHERWDGKGYPKGIARYSIPLYSRIISIVDTYDAMTSDRSYRNALSSEIAINELKKNSGTQFDPELVDIFLKHVVVSD